MIGTTQLKSFLDTAPKDRINEKQMAYLNLAIDATIKEIASVTRMEVETVEKSVSGFDIKWGPEDGWISYKSRQLSHHDGPLGDIIPHDCHMVITLCNPLPWPRPEGGGTYCIEVELPWPCPTIPFPG